MSNAVKLLKKIFKNPTILYVINQYGIYIIQFVNSLFIAAYLGPYYLGIWGYINLILGYLTQINLGISNSVNVIVSISKEKEAYVQKVIGNSLVMITGLSIIIVLLFFLMYQVGFSIGDKYNFNYYVIPVCIMAVITYFNSLFANVFRIYGKIFAIALNQALIPVSTLLIIPFFRGSELLWAMVLVNLASLLVSLIMYIVQTPVKLKFQFNFNIIKYIQKKGWFLFVYNTSFYLIFLTSKSFISANFRIEEYGYFTFSYSLANAVLLFLNALSFLIFPKTINRFANGNNEYIINTLRNVRTSYISTSHLLIHFLIFVFPFFLRIFPEYSLASDVFKVIGLTVVLYTNSFGYQIVLIARGREKQMAIIAFSALLLNVILVASFVYVLNIQFSYVMFSTMIVNFIYILVLGFTGRKEVGLSIRFKEVLKDIFPNKMLIPYITSVLLILISAPNGLFIIPCVLYILLNNKDLLKLKDLIIKIIKEPGFINI